MSLSATYREADLVSALKVNNLKAFSELYDRFAPNLLSSLLRIVHNQVQAEDLLQDSFVKIWLNIHQYDPAKGRLFTWMLRIAHNIGLTHLKYAKAADQRIMDYPLEMLGTVSPTYHAIGLAYWLNSTLTPNHHQMINLIYFQGYTYQEVSTEFGFPLGTVKTYVRQALQCLRDSEMAAGVLL